MKFRKLVVIPSDRIEDYEKKGTASWLENYYNPNKHFDKVYIVSPIEKKNEFKYGCEIIPVNNNSEYKDSLKKIKPDLIRSYGAYWATQFAIYNRTNIPIVASIHDTNPKLTYKAIKFADGIITMSPILNEILINKGVEKRKIHLLGNRVDLNTFKKIEDIELLNQIRNKFPEGKLILHVGRKSFEKNIENVVSSLKHLPDDFFIVFIGQGNSENYQSLAKELNVENRCFWMDKIENNELPYWYSACDFFCVPSRWEGFGVIFIEAAACQSAIITSNVRPMSDMFTDRVNAILINNFENPKEISSAILELNTNLDLKEKIKKESITVAQKYSQEIINSKEIEIYEQIINNYKKSKSISRILSYSYFYWKYQSKKSKSPILL